MEPEYAAPFSEPTEFLSETNLDLQNTMNNGLKKLLKLYKLRTPKDFWISGNSNSNILMLELLLILLQNTISSNELLTICTEMENICSKIKNRTSGEKSKITQCFGKFK